jgi:hypothetical protein
VKDRPGIVADVSEVIYECGGNIEDSSMNLLRNHFALLLLFSKYELFFPGYVGNRYLLFLVILSTIPLAYAIQRIAGHVGDERSGLS